MILIISEIPDIESKLAQPLLLQNDMSRYISKGVLLLTLSLVICCGLYVLSLWVIDPFEANSSTLTGPEIKVVDSRQIAQRFTKDEYVQPRRSAGSNDASASTSSAVAEDPLLPSPAQKLCYFYDC